jgi:hypothetical protein
MSASAAAAAAGLDGGPRGGARVVGALSVELLDEAEPGCSDHGGAGAGAGGGAAAADGGGEPPVLSFLRRHGLERVFVRLDDGSECLTGARFSLALGLGLLQAPRGAGISSTPDAAAPFPQYPGPLPGPAAASALALPLSRIAKSMGVLADGRPCIAVSRGDHKLDMHKAGTPRPPPPAPAPPAPAPPPAGPPAAAAARAGALARAAARAVSLARSSRCSGAPRPARAARRCLAPARRAASRHHLHPPNPPSPHPPDQPLSPLPPVPPLPRSWRLA